MELLVRLEPFVRTRTHNALSVEPRGHVQIGCRTSTAYFGGLSLIQRTHATRGETRWLRVAGYSFGTEQTQINIHHTCTGHNYPFKRGKHDTLAERLRRWPAKPLGSARVGSNPTGVGFRQPGAILRWQEWPSA